MKFAQTSFSFIKKLYRLEQYTTTMALILTLLCFYTLDMLKNEYSFSWRLIISVLCYLAANAVFMNPHPYLIEFKNSFSRVPWILAWIYGAFALVGVQYIDSDIVELTGIIGLFLLTCIWSAPIILILNHLMNNNAEKLSGEMREHLKGSLGVKYGLLTFGIVLLLSVAILIVYNPAITSFDSERCYALANDLIQGNPIPDEHPFLYVFFLSLLMRISKSITFMVSVQIVFFGLIITKAIGFLRRIGISKRVCFFVYIIFGIGYNTLFHLACLWKDGPYATAMLWLSILLAEEMCETNNTHMKKMIWSIEFVISCVLVVFLRHGGALPVILSAIGLLVVSKNKKRVILSLLSVCVLAVLVKYPLYRVCKVYSGGVNGMTYSALVSDIEYVYYNGGRVNSEVETLVKNASGEGEYEYDPWYCGNSRSGLSDCSMQTFIPLYLRTFAENPFLMIKGILIRTNYLWTFVKPENGKEAWVFTTSDSHQLEGLVEATYSYRKHFQLEETITDIGVKVTDNSIIHALFWRVGVYFGAILAVGLILGFSRIKTIKRHVIAFLPILGNDIVLVLGCGWPNYRYYWPNMLIGGVLIPYGIIVIISGYCELQSAKKVDNEESV